MVSGLTTTLVRTFGFFAFLAAAIPAASGISTGAPACAAWALVAGIVAATLGVVGCGLRFSPSPITGAVNSTAPAATAHPASNARDRARENPLNFLPGELMPPFWQVGGVGQVARSARTRARSKISSVIGSVKRPVKVFRWLG